MTTRAYRIRDDEEAGTNTERSDLVTLPSGAVVDLLHFNARRCRTLDDAYELMSVLAEKILDIEYHIRCHKLGCHPDGEPYSDDRPVPHLWLPRAEKALGWARLQKAEAQQNIQRLAQKERKAMEQQTARERAFIDIAKALLPDSKFQELMLAAIAVAAKQTGIQPKPNGKL